MSHQLCKHKQYKAAARNLYKENKSEGEQAQQTPPGSAAQSHTSQTAQVLIQALEKKLWVSS